MRSRIKNLTDDFIHAKYDRLMTISWQLPFLKNVFSLWATVSLTVELSRYEAMQGVISKTSLKLFWLSQFFVPQPHDYRLKGAIYGWSVSREIQLMYVRLIPFQMYFSLVRAVVKPYIFQLTPLQCWNFLHELSNEIVDTVRTFNQGSHSALLQKSVSR